MMKKYFGLFKNTWAEFGKDKAQRLGAALAYYTIFSIAPLLLIAIAIAGLVFGHSEAQAQIIGQIRSLMGAAGAGAIEQMLISAAKPKTGTLAIVIGAITLLLGAAGVFGQLKDALNTIWNVPEQKGGGIMKMIKDRFLSFAMVLGIGFLLLVSLVIDAAVSAAGKYAAHHLPGGTAIWQVLQLALSFVVITVLFAMIFRFLPDLHIEWRDVWLGAAFTALLFVIGKFALGLYLGKSAVGSSYGAAGSLVVLLVWIFWSANILFFGAEFTQVYAREHGSLRSEQPAASAGREGEHHEPARPAVRHPRPARAAGFEKIVFPAAGGLILGLIAGAMTRLVLTVKKLFRAAAH